MPALLPLLTHLSSLLHQCRFPAFWALFRSEDLEILRDNYTIECVGFEDSVREIAIRAVRAAFQRIGRQRLGSYLDLEGASISCCLLEPGLTVDTFVRWGFRRIHHTAGMVARSKDRCDRNSCEPRQPDRSNSRSRKHSAAT